MERLTSIDILKIFAAGVTFLFHCNIHLGVQFLFLTPFISQGAIVMDLFFMLSGWTLSVVYEKQSLFAGEHSLLRFYERRILSIYPLYVLIFLVFLIIPAWRGTASQILITLPVELALLQSWFSGLFAYSHNGGTWFISCLMFCFVIFPLLLQVIRLSTKRFRWGMLIACYMLCSTIPLMVIELDIPNAYSNPLLRLLEFFAGMLCAKEIREISLRPHRVAPWACASSLTLVGIVGITTKLFEVQLLRNQYITYGFATFPLFLFLICSSMMAEAGLKNRIPGKSFFRALSNHAYAVFMAQFFVWDIARSVKVTFPEYFLSHGNYKTLFLAALLCGVFTILLQDVFNAPVQRWIRTHLTA